MTPVTISETGRKFQANKVELNLTQELKCILHRNLTFSTLLRNEGHLFKVKRNE